MFPISSMILTIAHRINLLILIGFETFLTLQLGKTFNIFNAGDRDWGGTCSLYFQILPNSFIRIYNICLFSLNYVFQPTTTLNCC